MTEMVNMNQMDRFLKELWNNMNRTIHAHKDWEYQLKDQAPLWCKKILKDAVPTGGSPSNLVYEIIAILIEVFRDDIMESASVDSLEEEECKKLLLESYLESAGVEIQEDHTFWLYKTPYAIEWVDSVVQKEKILDFNLRKILERSFRAYVAFIIDAIFKVFMEEKNDI